VQSIRPLQSLCGEFTCAEKTPTLTLQVPELLTTNINLKIPQAYTVHQVALLKYRYQNHRGGGEEEIFPNGQPTALISVTVSVVDEPIPS